MCRCLMTLVLFLFASLGVVESAAEPFIHNAEIHPLGVAPADLGRAIAELRQRVTGDAWIAYTVPMVAGRQMLCCSGTKRCSLDRSRGFFMEGDPSGPPSTTLRVLLRVQDHQLSDIRAFSDRCPLDAGGATVYIWEAVDESQSFDFLVGEARAGRRKLAERTLLAIAHHETDEVDRMLEQTARGEGLPRLAKEAIFWLGETRGNRGFEALIRLRRDLEDRDLREQLTFALYLNDAPESLPILIEMARQDSDRQVRGQALFWLSQEAGEKAIATIAEASEEDPELEVKQRAIFAISQLPPDRGVPMLIGYAETHPHREIRKKAIFWLGQTEDPRALDFIEEILLR